MHLNDDQIAELDSAEFSNLGKLDSPENIATKAHVSNCSQCHKKWENVKHFRAKLAADTSRDMPKFDWQAIESEIFPRNKQNKLKQRVRRLQIACCAAAASLVIFVSYSYYTDSPKMALEIHLAALISENNSLQKDITQVTQNTQFQQIAFKSTELKIQEIDHQIQMSYVDDLPIEQKISLWSERKQLLIQSQIKQSKSAVFTI